MIKTIIAAVFLLSSFFMRAQQPVIVSPQWLNENIQDPLLVILQINSLRSDYEAGHIKGARFLWPDWLISHSPEASANPPAAKAAARILRKLGINNNSKVVLCYTKAEVSVAARLFTTLEYLGLKGQVFFLNGGLEAWKKAGYPVTREVPVVKKGNFAVRPTPVWADRNYVLSRIGTNTATIVDARLKRWYDGDSTGNPRDGHIAGAWNLPYTELIDTANAIKDSVILLEKFRAVHPGKNKEMITYCFTGQTSCVLYLAARHLGYQVKVYDGSIQEWSRIPELPMEKTKKE